MGCKLCKPLYEFENFITILHQPPSESLYSSNIYTFKFQIHPFDTQFIRELDPQFNVDLTSQQSQMISTKNGLIIFEKDNQLITKKDLISEYLTHQILLRLQKIQKQNINETNVSNVSTQNMKQNSLKENLKENLIHTKEKQTKQSQASIVQYIVFIQPQGSFQNLKQIFTIILETLIHIDITCNVQAKSKEIKKPFRLKVYFDWPLFKQKFQKNTFYQFISRIHENNTRISGKK